MLDVHSRSYILLLLLLPYREYPETPENVAEISGASTERDGEHHEPFPLPDLLSGAYGQPDIGSRGLPRTPSDSTRLHGQLGPLGRIQRGIQLFTQGTRPETPWVLGKGVGTLRAKILRGP